MRIAIHCWLEFVYSRECEKLIYRNKGGRGQSMCTERLKLNRINYRLSIQAYDNAEIANRVNSPIAFNGHMHYTMADNKLIGRRFSS